MKFSNTLQDPNPIWILRQRLLLVVLSLIEARPATGFPPCYILGFGAISRIG